MFFSCNESLYCHNRNPSQLRRSLRTIRLVLEHLEDRLTPTTLFSGGGTQLAQDQFNQFKTAIGGMDNGNNPAQANGFRTINWSEVALDGTDFGGNSTVIIRNSTVGIPTNRYQIRGINFDRVHAVSGDGFFSANTGVADQFFAGEGAKIFAPFNNNQVRVHFVRPSNPAGSPINAVVRGFGALFLDVDHGNSTSIEYFNGGASLGRFFVPAGHDADESFLGVLFDSPIVTDVLLTVGEGAIFSFNGTTVTPGRPDISNDPINGIDQVAMADVAFSEPLIKTATVVTSNVARPIFDQQAITFTATITPAGTGIGTPTGTVTFMDGSRVLGSSSLNAGIATLMPLVVDAGMRSITAVYSGDNFFSGSTSAPLVLNVRPFSYFAVGGAPGRVQVHNLDGSLAADFAPFGPRYTGAVNVAVGNITGDGFADIVVAAAEGNPHVKVYNGRAFYRGGRVFSRGNFQPSNPDASLLAAFFAYGLQFNIGATVAVGDIENDGFADLVTGASAGNPHVKVYSGRAIANGTFNSGNPDASLVAQFFAFELQFDIGANLAVGDVNNDGFAELVVGATIGNPHVKVYNGRNIANGTFQRFNPDAALLTQFFAYGLQFNVGANVAVGDTNGDGFADIITGATNSLADLLTGHTDSSPHVKVYSGRAIATGTFNPANPDASLLTQFFAYDLQFGTGVTVAAADFENNGMFDILTGATRSPHYRVVRGNVAGVRPPALFEGVVADFQGEISVGA